jgi:hypothetical protein
MKGLALDRTVVHKNRPGTLRVLNAFVGLWWADPVAALIMVPIIAKEGIEGLQGKACDECRAE